MNGSNLYWRSRRCVCLGYIALVERQLHRLTRIDSRRRNTDDGSDLIGSIFWLRDLHPLLHPRVELVRRYVLAGDDARFLPIAGKRLRECEILPDRGVVGLACRRLRIEMASF